MKLKEICLLTLTLMPLTSVFSSAMLTNKMTGIGPDSFRVNPHFCVKSRAGAFIPVEPDDSINLALHASKDGYVGGAIRFGGCDENKNAYLGWLSLNAKSSGIIVTGYTPFEHVHVEYKNIGIDAKGNLVGEIKFTEIPANTELMSQEPRINPVWKFAGANLSGLEFGKMIDPVVIPNLSQEDAASNFSDLKEIQAFLAAGMNTFRIPLSWDYLQWNGAGKGEINQEYYHSYVKPLLETLTRAHVTAIIDLHTYMRYSEYGKEYSGCGAEGKCPDGTLVLDEKKYQDVWLKLLALLQANPAINMDYIAIDLFNEPVEVPDDKVFTIQASLIKALREHGFNNYILVEGNSWTGLHSWTTKSWTSSDGKQTYTNASLFSRENFAKHGIHDLSKIIINVHQYLDSDFSGTHDICRNDLMSKGEGNYNLSAFVDYLQQNQLQAMVTEFGAGRDSNTCAPALRQFMQYLKDNALTVDKGYGFIGWTIWSTGHGWGNYNLRVTPTDYKMQVLKEFLIC